MYLSELRENGSRRYYKVDEMRKHDLLLLELDSLNKCIEQWISFLDMFAKGKRMSEEYYKKLSAAGVDLPTAADNLAADQRSIDYVKNVIEEYQDKRDQVLARL